MGMFDKMKQEWKEVSAEVDAKEEAKREAKEEKQKGKMENKVLKKMQKYGLENLDEKDIEIFREISAGMNKVSNLAGMATFNMQDQAKISHLNTLVEQNWLIIRKLDQINSKLDR